MSLRPVSQGGISRNVKVAVHCYCGKTSADIDRLIFSNFFFQWTPESPVFCGETSANLAVDIVEDHPDLLRHISVGQDPYQRPFLYLYVFDVGAGRGLTEDQEKHINFHVNDCEMTKRTYLILIMQTRVFKREIILPRDLPDKGKQNTFVIQYKIKGADWILSEDSVKLIREVTKDRIKECFTQCLAEANQGKSQGVHEAVRRAWKSLLLYSFGFTSTALKEFESEYQDLMKERWEVSSLVQRHLNRESLSGHPFWKSERRGQDQQDKLEDILLFALEGMMAVNFTQIHMDKVVNMFFLHVGRLRNMCENDQDEANVDEWYQDGLTKLCDLLFGNASNSDLAINLHFRRFVTQIARGDPRKEYQQLFSLFSKVANPHSHHQIATNVLYMFWCVKNGFESKLLDISPFMGWDLGIKCCRLCMERALVGRKATAADIEKYARLLLTGRLPAREKVETIEKLSRLERQTVIGDPCRLIIHNVSGPNTALGPAVVGLHVRLPDWANVAYTEATVVFSTNAGHIGERKCEAKAMDPVLAKLEVETRFPLPGIWNISSLSLSYYSLTFQWTVVDPVNISVTRQSPPAVSIRLPRIIVDNRPQLCHISMDLTARYSDESVTLRFADNDVAAFIPQSGIAVYNDWEKVPFSISETGSLNFDRSPFLKRVALDLSFRLFKHPVSDLTVVFKVGESGELLTQTVYSDSFPVTVEGRLISEGVMHVRLKNVCGFPLYMRTAGMDEVFVKPDDGIYLLRDKNSEMTLSVHEEDCPVIEKTFILDESIMIPTIPSTLSRVEDHVGETIRMKLSLPKCSEYELITNKYFVVTGKTHATNFCGGEVEFGLIPMQLGALEMPVIRVDGQNLIILPQFLHITCASLLSLSPIVDDTSDAISGRRTDEHQENPKELD